MSQRVDIKEFFSVLEKLLNLRENPPALPGALTSGILEKWLNRRHSLMTHLQALETPDHLPPDLIKRIMTSEETESDFLHMLALMNREVLTRLEIIGDAKIRRRGYGSSSGLSNPGSGLNLDG